MITFPTIFIEILPFLLDAFYSKSHILCVGQFQLSFLFRTFAEQK